MQSSAAVRKYETTEASRNYVLSRLLGDFWVSIYDSADQINHLNQTRGELFDQQFRYFRQIQTLVSRHQSQVFREREWVVHPIRRSEAEFSYRSFDLTRFFFNGLNAGDYDQFGDSLIWRLPEGVVDVQTISDRIQSPELILLQGLDFQILRQGPQAFVQFFRDPFEQGFSVQELDGDQLLDLWLNSVAYDEQWIFRHWGYVLGIYSQSSESFKQLINAIFDCLTNGSSHQNLLRLLEGATGTRTAVKQETVEQVIQFGPSLAIITGSESYVFPSSCRSLVQVGDTVVPGQCLADSFRIYPLNRGQVPDNLTLLAVSPSLIQVPVTSELVFPNEEQPWQGVVDEKGRLKLFFSIGGNDQDREAFFEEMHQRGLDRDETLAEILDPRPEGQTSPVRLDNLPGMVNPARFVIQNCLRYNAVFVDLKTGLVDASVARLIESALRHIICPESLILIREILDQLTSESTLGEAELIDPIENQPTLNSQMLLGADLIQAPTGGC